MLEQIDSTKHSTVCPCNTCKVHGICKLEEFITYNLDTIQIPEGLSVHCSYHTTKGYTQRD